jgi:class 3 adenylate cyclase/predicted ATPase
MDCPGCAAANQDGKKFCGECGNPLPRCCPTCGHANAASNSFCGGCGARLIGDTSRAQTPSSPARAEAERRQLTVLFCDLVGSTELSARLDPEDMGQVIRAYQQCCAGVVKRWDGHIANYMGDGVLALFGYPQAHEDDAERAVRAGLEMTAAVGRLKTDDAPLAARVGIATGQVVAGELFGDGAAQEQSVIGETPNLAARLQALAEPGTVIVAAGTRRLLGGLFELVDLGPTRLKGFAEPLAAFRVVGEGRAQGRFEALHEHRLTPLVGREHELGLLLDCWDLARGGDGQAVLLSGEPGIGKSRIAKALADALVGEQHSALCCQCSPYHADSPLWPVTEQLGFAAGFARNDDDPTRLRKLEALLRPRAGDGAETVVLLATLLGIEPAGRYPVVEELTKAVLESGQLREAEGGWVLEGVLPSRAIPSSLQDSLMARLDRLASAKQVAQVAACIGRQFERALLAAVTPLPAAELGDALDRLVVNEIVFRREGAADSVYAFKHALVQDAAYASMLKSRRQQVHAAIAAALERGFPEIGATQPEVIARHSELAGQMECAVEYWQRAGELAIARSATAEAAAHLDQAVRCLAALPPTHERRLQELRLQASLGPALIHVKGYAAPETGRAWARARALCRELGASDPIGPVLFGQYVFHYVRSEFKQAREAARELLEFGHERGDAAARLVGMRNLGVICLSTGEFADGRQHLEPALEGLQRLDERSLTLAYGQDLRTTGMLWLAKILLAQGFPERALAAGEEGLRRSEGLGHPNTRAFTLCHAAKLIALTRDARATIPLANATVEFATEQGYAQWLAEAWVFRGWARAELGELEAGVAELDRGARAYRASGAVHWRGTHLGLHGRVLALQGRLDEARDLLAEALRHTRSTGERWFEADLERIMGEVLAQGARVEEAGASFSRAMAIARKQGARMWELRAATSLARLQVERGEPRKARNLLAPVYGWFTEGFDTPDLKDAKALLDELG